MKDIEGKFRKNIQIGIKIFIAIVIFLIFIGKENYTNLIAQWFSIILIGLGTTAISQPFVQQLTGDFFVKYLLNIKILGKEFSISLFIIISLVVTFWLF